MCGGASMTVVEVTAPLNDEQLEAAEAAGSVLVSAGAGTGKTSVLVERQRAPSAIAESTSSRSS